MAVQVANHRDIRRKQEVRKPAPRNVSDRAEADNARSEQNRSLLFAYLGFGLCDQSMANIFRMTWLRAYSVARRETQSNFPP